MAKRQSESGGGYQQPARVRYFELEGSDETIQKALATFERMRNPGVSGPPTPKRVAPSDKNSPELPLFEQSEQAADAETASDTAEQADDNVPSTRRKRGDGPAVDRNSGITAAGDVDFYPQGKASLKDFFKQKTPATDMEKCLVFCFYLQETLTLSPFGIRHVLAGFNHVGEPIPKDLAGTLRNMKEGKKGGKAWLGATEIENIRVTTGGLNYVRFELGKKGAPFLDGAK